VGLNRVLVLLVLLVVRLEVCDLGDLGDLEMLFEDKVRGILDGAGAEHT